MKQAVVSYWRKGKVGTYLVPMLVEDGFEVINVSRGVSKLFISHQRSFLKFIIAIKEDSG